MIQTEVLVIGCGIAGATAALCLARNPQRKVTLLTNNSDPEESNTRYAQGGIVGRGPDDSPASLVADILSAGAGASNPNIAKILADEGPALLDEILIGMAKIEFDRNQSGQLEWGREAAHSLHRILHIGDGSGQVIISGLLTALKQYPNINIITN